MEETELNQSQMGECILMQEKLAYMLHNSQRMNRLEKAPYHERVAHIMRAVNHSLSVVDTSRDAAISAHTQDLLRNSRVKSELALFLALQAQLQRMSYLIDISGAIDAKLCDANMISSMSVNQLIMAQRSVHAQQFEIIKLITDARTEGLEGLMKTLSPEGSQEVRETVATISSLPPQQRERLMMFMRKLLGESVKASSVEVAVSTDAPNTTK